ncbi:MAG: autotransporter domain-containing protein [Rubripirellula sp.]
MIIHSKRQHRTRRLLLALMGAALISGNANAADVEVTTAADAGAGSLREAMTNAASGDRIVFNLPAVSTITLASDLPAVAGDISFNNPGPAVTIDRNAFAGLSLTGSLVDPTTLTIVTGGIPSLDDDIIAGAASTVFGDGTFTGNLKIPGTLAPGASSEAGTIGTLAVTGDLDVAGAETQFDISSTTTGNTSDLVTVSGTADVTGATLAPSFVGDQYAAGQTFLVLDSANPLVGAFTNEASIFELPSNPFLEAVSDGALGADDFGFAIRDNGESFTTLVTGCNAVTAAASMDEMLASGGTPAAITALRDGGEAQSMLAISQLSGGIYASLISAEINHIQNNIESVRDRIAGQRFYSRNETRLMPWVRAYGHSGEVDRDDCDTAGYRHEVAGIELGVGVDAGNAFTSHFFAHLGTGDLYTRGSDQQAEIDSYRFGSIVHAQGDLAYLILAGGAGTQQYDVTRSLSAFAGSTAATSSFDGASTFGYLEIGRDALAGVSPYAALHGSFVELDPFSETGDPDFALSNAGTSGESLRGILGVSLLGKSHIATTRLRFGWMHEYLDEAERVTSQFATASASNALVDQGVKPGIDWGFVRTQVDIGAFLGGQASVAYQGQFNSRSSFNQLFAGSYWVF